MFANLLPADVTGHFFERDNEIDIRSVAANNKQVIDKNRRTAVAVTRFIFEFLILPNDFASECQTSRSVSAEVDEDVLAVRDW